MDNFAKITKISTFDKGKRVLLDFMEEFSCNDCIFVGNTFYGFFALPSENHPSENYLPRPFRFNAGAINQYVLTENGVKYLSEVKMGDKIAVLKNGNLTYYTIARVKCEIRDFCLIQATLLNQTFSVIVQNGDTTTFMGKNGLVFLKDLACGDEILIYPHNNPTHLGKEKQEFCEEY